jgi:hypothetical protein
MSLLNRKSAIILGLLATLVTLGASATPAFAHTVTGCTESPTGTITVPLSGSTVVKFTITYDAFASNNNPVTLSATSISSHYTANSSSFSPNTGFGTHTHTFYIRITNTGTAVTSGSATFTLSWPNSSGGSGFNDCAPISLTTPPTHGIGVPEFPTGMAVLMALAIPALLLVRSKSKIIAA